MKIFVLISITALFLTACSPASSDENGVDTDKITPVSTAPLAVPKELAVTEAILGETTEDTVLTEKIGSVTVEIQNIQKTDSQTILDIVMDNHIYDLSSKDVLNLSTLNGIKPDDYQISKAIMGGHHINATMTFAGDLSGSLIIGLDDELIFNFDI